MTSVSERRSGHSKLVYDKAKRTIVAVDPLPADPASSEGADEVAKPHDGPPHMNATEAMRLYHEKRSAEWGQRNLARAFLNCDADPAAARGNLVLLAECNLLLLEETCRYSLGLAEDLIGDALTKAVGDKVIAMRDEAATLRAALEKIAKDEKVLRGYGDFDEGPMSSDVCQSIAREALVTRWLLFGGGLPEVAKLEIPPRDGEGEPT